MTAAGVIPADEFTAPQRVSKERLEKLKAMGDDPEAIAMAISAAAYRSYPAVSRRHCAPSLPSSDQAR